MDQIYLCISRAKLENIILTHRIYKIYTNLNILFYNSGSKCESNCKKTDTKTDKQKYLYKIEGIEKIIVEYFLYLPLVFKNSLYLNQKKMEIIELSYEIKKLFLIVDLFGIVQADEGIKDYFCELNQIELQTSKISFHIFRKLKNFKNIILIGNNFGDKSILSYIFKDKLIKHENISQFIGFFLETCQLSAIYWSNFLETNLKFFFHWITNINNYKIKVDKILSNVSFLKTDNGGKLKNEDSFLNSNFNYTQYLKLKNFGTLLPYSSELESFTSFIKYGGLVSMVFENPPKVEENISEMQNIKLSNVFFSSDSDQYMFDTLGFFYFREILVGILTLRIKLIKLEKTQIPFGFEKKIIFSMGLMACKNFSKKLLYFFVKKIRLQDVRIFLNTGDFMVFKNLSYSCLTISLIPTKFMEILSEKKLKKCLSDLLVEIINKFELTCWYKYYSNHFSPSNLRTKTWLNLYTKFLISFLLSLSLSQLKNSKIFYNDYFSKLLCLLKFISNESILNREQDILIRFLPLIFGVLVLGTEASLNLFSFKLYLPGNRVLQQIFIRMMQYCSYLGTNRKELIGLATKEIRLFESIKTKKSERAFIINEKCKKNKIPLIFLSIYDLNTDKELDRSFIYLRTNIQGSIIGLCLLSFGNKLMSKIIYRVQSFFLSSDSIEYSSFAILSVSFLFVSNTDCPAIEFISKLSGNKDFIVAKNSIFSLGLIGAGTNNTRIKNALKSLANFYKLKLESNLSKKRLGTENDDFQFFRKIKSIIFLIRLSQGMVNSLYNNLLQKNVHTGKLNISTISCLLFALFSFMISNFIGNESIFVCFFLFGRSLKSKLVCLYGEDFKVISVRVKTPLIKKLNHMYILTPCFLHI